LPDPFLRCWASLSWAFLDGEPTWLLNSFQRRFMLPKWVKRRRSSLLWTPRANPSHWRNCSRLLLLIRRVLRGLLRESCWFFIEAIGEGLAPPSCGGYNEL